MLCWFFFFKQKTAYEMRISDWSSDVCSSDLEQQVRTFDHFANTVAVFLGGLAANFRIGPGPQTTRDLDAELDLIGRHAAFEMIAIGIGAHEVNAINAGLRHLIDRKSTRLNSSH